MESQFEQQKVVAYEALEKAIRAIHKLKEISENAGIPNHKNYDIHHAFDSTCTAKRLVFLLDSTKYNHVKTIIR